MQDSIADNRDRLLCRSVRAVHPSTADSVKLAVVQALRYRNREQWIVGLHTLGKRAGANIVANAAEVAANTPRARF